MAQIRKCMILASGIGIKMVEQENPELTYDAASMLTALNFCGELYALQNGITEKSCFINDNEQSTYFFFFLAKLQGLWDFSSLTKDRTQVLSSESMES